MKNKKITRKITQGVYALTTKDGGCIVDAVSQVGGGEFPLISVAVMKQNYTNKLLKDNKQFAISVLGRKVSPTIIQTFGFQSSKDINKFKEIETFSINDMNIIKDSLGYMICEVIDTIENDTHTIFIGKLIEADLFKEEEPMSYAYYQEHKEEFVKVKTENNQLAFICTICGYVYYGELPDDFKCPKCGVDKSFFQKIDK